MRDDVIFTDIDLERRRQDAKWGADRNHDAYRWLAILSEEHGEVARAILEAEFGDGTVRHLRQELVQVAAVAVAIIDCIDRNQAVLFPEQNSGRAKALETI
jgi:NTP pyrophosphatase (non-canonical NTP hydrolase)